MIILFISYDLSSKCVFFVGLFLFVFMNNLLPDAYLHFRFLISLYFGVSKSAKQYLSCSSHCQLCILLDFVVAGVLQVNT